MVEAGLLLAVVVVVAAGGGGGGGGGGSCSWCVLVIGRGCACFPFQEPTVNLSQC